ncbi:MAG: hypothetical protein PHI40_04840 [Caldisericia bacterium]|nr:hypothetical protein [Caldisericia bacterium]MDD4614720.1 hypothetical protein [Caldisericia bacterium]
MEEMNHRIQHEIHSQVSMTENVIGTIIFMLGIHVFLKNIPHAYKFSILFISAFVLFIGVWFIVDFFLYRSSSSAIPGILFPTLSLFLMIDFFSALPLSFSHILFISALFGGTIAFGVLYNETGNKTYPSIAWIFGILFGLQVLSKFPFIKAHIVQFWPVLLIIAGGSILWKVFRKN